MRTCAVSVNYLQGNPHTYRGFFVRYTDDDGFHRLVFYGQGPTQDWQRVMAFVAQFDKIVNGTSVAAFLEDAGYDIIMMAGIPTMIQLIPG